MSDNNANTNAATATDTSTHTNIRTNTWAAERHQNSNSPPPDSPATFSPGPKTIEHSRKLHGQRSHIYKEEEEKPACHKYSYSPWHDRVWVRQPALPISTQCIKCITLDRFSGGWGISPSSKHCGDRLKRSLNCSWSHKYATLFWHCSRLYLRLTNCVAYFLAYF